LPAIQWTTNGGTTWLTQTQLNGGSLPSLFTVSFAPTPFELPVLRLTQSSPSQVTLSWPTNTAGFVLETTLTLPNATWITVTNAPVIGIHNQFNLSVATTNAQQYFSCSALDAPHNSCVTPAMGWSLTSSLNCHPQTPSPALGESVAGASPHAVPATAPRSFAAWASKGIGLVLVDNDSRRHCAKKRFRTAESAAVNETKSC
jgi:hypothetical protein